MYKSPSIQVYKYTSMQVYQITKIQVESSADISDFEGGPPCLKILANFWTNWSFLHQKQSLGALAIFLLTSSLQSFSSFSRWGRTSPREKKSKYSLFLFLKKSKCSLFLFVEIKIFLVTFCRNPNSSNISSSSGQLNWIELKRTQIRIIIEVSIEGLYAMCYQRCTAKMRWFWSVEKKKLTKYFGSMEQKVNLKVLSISPQKIGSWYWTFAPQIKVSKMRWFWSVDCWMV